MYPHMRLHPSLRRACGLVDADTSLPRCCSPVRGTQLLTTVCPHVRPRQDSDRMHVAEIQPSLHTLLNKQGLAEAARPVAGLDHRRLGRWPGRGGRGPRTLAPRVVLAAGAGGGVPAATLPPCASPATAAPLGTSGARGAGPDCGRPCTHVPPLDRHDSQPYPSPQACVGEQWRHCGRPRTGSYHSDASRFGCGNWPGA